MQEQEQEQKIFNVPPLTKYLVATLIGIHILLMVTDRETLIWIYETFAFDMNRLVFLLDGQGGSWGHLILTLVSHMFLHHDFMHLLINAFMLMAFGSMIERFYGVSTFLSIFLLTGWMGAISEFIVSAESGGILYGASGAVFGMMGATLRILLPKFGLQKIIGFACVMMGINLIIGLTPLAALLTGGEANISWAAHLGGFVTGIVLSLIFRPHYSIGR